MIDMRVVVHDPDFSALWTIKSRGAGVIGSDGFGIENTASTREVRGVVQPASGREVQILPEGLRTKAAITCHFVERINHAQSPDGAPGDQVYFDSAWYEVQTCEPWAGLGNYFRCIAVRLGQ